MNVTRKHDMAAIGAGAHLEVLLVEEEALCRVVLELAEAVRRRHLVQGGGGGRGRGRAAPLADGQTD